MKGIKSWGPVILWMLLLYTLSSIDF